MVLQFLKIMISASHGRQIPSIMQRWQNHFLNINNWIVNNAEERKIKYVIHTGDIVDDVDMTYEWEKC